MIQKTHAIALSYIKYKDTSIIARLYTREFGCRSYILNSVRQKNKGNKMIFFQPMSLLDLVVYEDEKRDINRISELKFLYQPKSIPFDVKRSSVILFLSEFLEKLILGDGTNHELFDFMTAKIIDFDREYSPDFHIHFLFELSKRIGIDISDDYFDSSVAPNGTERRKQTDALLQHYFYHLDHNKPLKSLSVLASVMEN